MGIFKNGAAVDGVLAMTSCKLLSHKWDYASGGTRACKRCGTHERFNTLKSEWQAQ